MTDKPTGTQNGSDQKPAKKFYQVRFFWFLAFIAVFILLVSLINLTINKKQYQQNGADLLYRLTKTKVEFNNIFFELLYGKIAGSDLNVQVEKIGLSLSLKEFELKFNPVYLLMGRFKITQIHAKEFWLDTSQLEAPKKGPAQKKSPPFLQAIRLNQAKISTFFWNQPNGKQISVEKISLTSRFASVFYKSPIILTAEKIAYHTPKLDIFADELSVDGFFLFDLSQPRILDESRLEVEVSAKNLLLAIFRRPKPWLDTPAWDADLKPFLKRYYPQDIPEDRSYLFVQEVLFEAQKSLLNLAVNNLKINFFENYLAANGFLNLHNNDFKLKLKTLSPMPLSKLPLGQSKFRQAFEKFTVELSLKGKLTSLEKNDLSFILKNQLVGNRMNPQVGDASLSLEGSIKNNVLKSDLFQIRLDEGTITAQTSTKLDEFTTQTAFQAQNMDTQSIIRLFSTVNIPALVDGSGSVSGKLNNPRIDIDMRTNNAAYEFLNFGQAAGKLHIDNNNLSLNVQTAASAVGQAQLGLTVKNVFSPFDQFLDLASTYSNIDIQKMLNARSLNGNISGRFDLKRSQGTPHATGEFTTKEFLFFDRPVGDVDFKIVLKEKHLDVRPLVIRPAKTQKILTIPQGLGFDFSEGGYQFSGMILPSLKVAGSFTKANHNFLNLKLTPDKMDLELFSSLMPLITERSVLSGIVELDYHIYDPYQSHMTARLSEMKLLSADGEFLLNKPSGLDYANRSFVFKNFDVTIGKGRMTLDGPLGLADNSALRVKGAVDFTPLVDFNPYISESESPVEVDVTLKENIFKPKVYGKILLNEDTIRFRNIDTDLENMTGTLVLEGSKISTDRLSLIYDDAPVKLSGFVSTDFEKVTGADLKITGKEVPLNPVPGLSLLSDLNLHLTGQNQLTLTGHMNLVDGLYSRNYSITNFIVSPAGDDLDMEKTSFAGLPLTTQYKLQLKNTGELIIRNNIAELEMNAELDLAGTIENPDLTGQLDFLTGKIHAFGIDFDDARGFAQFKKGKGLLPDVDVTAKKEIQGYNISARIEGQATNLRLRLDSQPALDYREILSVIFYGQTPDQLTQESRRDFTRTAAISQLAGILSQPLYQVSGLDVLQVSTRRERSTQSIQRLTVGKNLSDRFGLTFTTDLGITDPERAFELRLQVYDNIYLIMAKDIVGGNRYRFDTSLDFEWF